AELNVAVDNFRRSVPAPAPTPPGSAAEGTTNQPPVSAGIDFANGGVVTAHSETIGNNEIGSRRIANLQQALGIELLFDFGADFAAFDFNNCITLVGNGLVASDDVPRNHWAVVGAVASLAVIGRSAWHPSPTHALVYGNGSIANYLDVLVA